MSDREGGPSWRMMRKEPREMSHAMLREGITGLEGAQQGLYGGVFAVVGSGGEARSASG